MTTSELRKALYNYLSMAGQCVCHEVAVSKDPKHGLLGKSPATGRFIREGRVDMVMYHRGYRDRQATFRFYEMKISVEDFKSLHGHNFEGHYNYYVLPNLELFAKIKDRIPAGVGCLVYDRTDLDRDGSFFVVVKKPKRQELQCDCTKLTHNFIVALSRECCRHNVGYYKAR